ncbi:MAG: F0F1 ATP synthase subunit A [Clostridiales bacterium]|nr:F0F1 ATP synthase subunit A [Clostridiales bacterium]
MPITMGLKEELLDELEIQTVFTIPHTNISVDETTVVSWIIMAALTILAIILTRNLKVEGELSKRQQILEVCMDKMVNFFKGNLGEKGVKYMPWLMSIGIFIGASNMIGLLGFKPPTKSMQVTAAMALTSIVLVEFAGFKERGVKGHLKSFTQPVAIVTPINVLEILIKPLSLCMRLFGNVIGAFIIMELIKSIIFFKIGISLAFSFYFDLFDGFLQAYIFVFLTSMYIQEAIEE